MSNLRKIGIGSLLLTASRVIVNALGFISTITLARLLMPEDFGLIAIAATLQAITGAVTSTPVSQALIQVKDPSQSHLNTAFTIELLRSIVVALIFAGLSWPTAKFFGDDRLQKRAADKDLMMRGTGEVGAVFDEIDQKKPNF